MAFHSRAITSPGATSSPRSRAARPARSMRRANCAPARQLKRSAGFKPSRRTPLARTSAHIAALTAASIAFACYAGAEQLRPYNVVGDGIAESLTGAPGDAARGRALVLARTTTCILCHSGPFPETRFQGDLAPDLSGAGNRWTVSQLRLRLVDAARFNPETIMPSYYRTDHLVRVGRNFVGKPILSAAEIEDIVAFIAALRD